MADINIYEMKRKNCPLCSKVPLVDIKTPQQYLLCIGSMARMVLNGDADIVYQNCPLDQMMDKDNNWVRKKFFHQFKCRGCGTIYGMLFNTAVGGQIKINAKVFDPNDYPDPEPEKKAEEQ